MAAAGKATVPDVTETSAISPLAKDCLERFQTLLALLPKPDKPGGTGFDTDSTRLAIEDARARFKAWGTSIAAFHDGKLRTSLDFRLNEAPGIRGRTLQVLRDLQEYLNEATSIVVGDKINKSWSLDNMSDSTDDSEEDTRHEDDSRHELTDDSQKQTTSDLEELLKAISASNSSLIKLSIVVRSSATRDDYLKAASGYKTWNPYPDIGHVKEKYGHAKYSEHWLLERLGKAITKRRQFLKYRTEHHEKMAGLGDPDEKHEKPEKIAQTIIASVKATRFIGDERRVLQNVKTAGSEMGNSIGSQTSYDPTVFGSDGAPAMLTVPPPPKMAFTDVPFDYGEPFQCPYCFTEQVVNNKAAWKKHVFRDLKPYVCTFDGCEMLLFQSRNEWFAHEMKDHRKEWFCQFCEHTSFPSIFAFSNHIRSAHAAVLDSSSLEVLILQSEEQVERILSDACPLCDDWEAYLKRKLANQSSVLPSFDSESEDLYGKPKQFCKHLGQHMEQLALFALPSNHEDGELEDESSDDGDSELNLKPTTENLEQELEAFDDDDNDSGGTCSYQKPRAQRIFCTQCEKFPEGFRGAYELRRHQDRQHAPLVKQWVCIDPTGDGLEHPTPVLPLSNCRACAQQEKRYGAYYNAAAHLRRTHFRSKRKKGEKHGRKGGDWPLIAELKYWMKEVEEPALRYSLDDSEEDLSEGSLADPSQVSPEKTGQKKCDDCGGSGMKTMKRQNSSESKLFKTVCQECYRTGVKNVQPPASRSDPVAAVDQAGRLDAATESLGIQPLSTTFVNPNLLDLPDNSDPLDSSIDFSEFETAGYQTPSGPSHKYNQYKQQTGLLAQQQPMDPYNVGNPYDSAYFFDDVSPEQNYRYNQPSSVKPSRSNLMQEPGHNFESNELANLEINVGPLWPGMHSQQAALAKAQAQQKEQLEQLRVIAEQRQAALRDDEEGQTGSAAKETASLGAIQPSQSTLEGENLIKEHQKSDQSNQEKTPPRKLKSMLMRILNKRLR